MALLTLFCQTVWVSAGQVLLEELVALRTSHPAHGPASDRETDLFEIFNTGFQDMIRLAESCVLLSESEWIILRLSLNICVIEYQVRQIQEAFAAL